MGELFQKTSCGRAPTCLSAQRKEKTLGARITDFMRALETRPPSARPADVSSHHHHHHLQTSSLFVKFNQSQSAQSVMKKGGMTTFACYF